MNLSPMELAEKIHAGTTPDIKPAVKRKLESLVQPIVVLRKLANEVCPDCSSEEITNGATSWFRVHPFLI